jgi:hypothetical protein
MDWGRYLRAFEVENIQTIEKLRALQIDRGIELSQETWEMILEHDRLAES